MAVYSNLGMFCFESRADQRRRVFEYLDRRYFEGSLFFLLSRGDHSAISPGATGFHLFLMREQVPLNELFLHLKAAVMSGADVVNQRQLSALFITTCKQL